MLETPHVAVGAAIAVKVANPVLALPLSLGSHFLLDRIPHWNPHTYTETKKYGRPKNSSLTIAVADTVSALALGLAVAHSAGSDTAQSIIIILACFIAVLPDVIKSPFYLLKNRNGILKKYVNFERSLQVETNVYVGMFTQIAIVLASIWWIYG